MLFEGIAPRHHGPNITIGFFLYGFRIVGRNVSLFHYGHLGKHGYGFCCGQHGGMYGMDCSVEFGRDRFVTQGC